MLRKLICFRRSRSSTGLFNRRWNGASTFLAAACRKCLIFLFRTGLGFRGKLSRKCREASCTALTSNCWIFEDRVIFLSETRVRTADTAQNYFAASDLRTHESIALQDRNSCSPTVVNVKGQNRSGIKGLDALQFLRRVFISFLTKSK